MSDLDSATAILSTATETLEAPASQSSPEPADSSPDTDSAAVQPPDGDSSATPDESTDDGSTPAGDVGDKSGQLPTTAQIRASLKAFREANPEHAQAAKLLNDGYSRYEAYKSVFDSVDTARTVKAHLDTVGGLEGLADLQSLATSIEETDALLAEGDPQVLDQIAEDSPDGFKKLARPYLSKLQKLDPETYQRTIQPHFARALIDANLPGVLSALSKAVADKPEAKAIVQDIINWLDQQKSLASRADEDTLLPERQQLAKERADLTKSQRAEFEAGINTAVGTHINQELGGRLKQYAAALNALPMGQRQAVARACIVELAEALKADKAYQATIEPLMNARKPNRDRIVGLNKAKVTALADSVIAKVAKDFGLKPGAVKAASAGGKKPGAQATPKSTRIIKLAAAPKDSEIDWEYPDAQRAFIQHRAALKDGRLVEWPR